LLLERSHINFFTMPRLKRVAIEVLEALDVLHSLDLVHCDLKPENILISNFNECHIKVIDFGSACFITDELTSYVQSRSYRAPEVILGLGYDQKIDVWSLGCVLAELFTGEVLFKNDSEQSLLERIIGAIGEFPPHWHWICARICVSNACSFAVRPDPSGHAT
jgi:dual specificity tyrosine-phosphorylation-regulated kinase 2/3/4